LRLYSRLHPKAPLAPTNREVRGRASLLLGKTCYGSGPPVFWQQKRAKREVPMTQTTAEIRSSFLQFFAERNHTIVPSSSLLPQNDPTLMFNNAGMVQFKDVFTGKEVRDYKRAASSQKCIRISGKHNDLEAVGPSPRHHTFFEMLGNFSFGDYFKEDAIVFAWEYLTGVLGLPKERLCITYFRGDDSIPRDDEAARIWKKVTGFGDDRIIALGEDNFWQMGDTGPCGPSSEIFFCNGDNIDPSKLEAEQDAEGNGWMEIWNLVFMQFERSREDGKIITAQLPKPSIDTGAGLERLSSVVQGKKSNYGVDLLENLVLEAAKISQKNYGGTMEPDDVSMRVIADHARTSAFLIAEGILPEKTGRQYVLRRVLRRAVRHGHRLGIQKPFLHQVAARVVDTMGDQYPELRERIDLIQSVIEAEETRFRDTIEKGLSHLNERFHEMQSTHSTELSGEDAFKLNDTYGFPLDLTVVICAEKGFTVDERGYDEELQRARSMSRLATQGGRGNAVESVYREALQLVPKEEVVFTGYDRDTDEAAIVALICDGQLVDAVEVGGDEGRPAPVEVEIVTARTCFYGESGGQIGDYGTLTLGDARVEITDTQKPIAGLIVHRGMLVAGRLEKRTATLTVNAKRRAATRRNHSATHLVHWALRQVLGNHAQQKGSLVGPDRLRFDFTHNAPLTADETREIERLVNEQVLLNHPIQTEVLTMQQARERGATMIFEEKYGDVVRMLTMGPSTELCGGTHARATGEIGLVKITSEQGVAAGVRRLLATTGEGSLSYVQGLEGDLEAASEAAKTNPEGLREKIEKMVDRQKSLEKEIESLKKQIMTGGGSGGIDSMLKEARELCGAKVLGIKTEVSDRAAMRELAEQLRDKLGDSIVLVGAADGPKVALVVTVSKSLTNKFRAGELIKAAAEKVGGTGGGRPDMAQAGGTNVGGLDDAVEAIYGAVTHAAGA
jgi:alanyl-tRNA synthetase